MRLCTDTDLPVRCSTCLQPPAVHEPKIRYIDFEVAYDGPVVDSGEPGVPGVYMEKIVICEHCVAEAARLIGLGDVDLAREQIDAWKTYAHQGEDEIAEKDRVIADLGHTVGVLLDTPVKRPPGRPQLRGPETHEEEIKKMRSAQRKKETRAKASSGANR